MITLKIKMPTKQHDIQIEDNASVNELRKIVAQTVSKEPSQLVLIFGGKILKDEDTLATHSIQNGHSVHLVIKNQRQESKPEVKQEAAAPAAPPQSAPASQTAAPSTNPFAGLAGMGGGMGAASGMGGLLGGMNGGMNEQMQQLMNNPELMNQLMDSPVMQNMMQNILDNPQLLQEMIRANPQMNQVMEQNPDLAHIFNNPSLIRQAMEMHRNPSMMQEMMRHQDRAMSNIENLPGGFQALERMYRDIQEPMMNAANRPNQYQTNTSDNNASNTSNQAGRQNTEALPNPWGGGGTNTQQTNAERPTSNTTGNTSSPFGAMNNPAMMQSTMEMMRNNPELMRSLMQTMNPQLANNPQMSRMLENYISNPEMSNPAVLQALQQIQQGYETIRREAPRFWESFGAGMDNNMQQMMQRMGTTGLSGGAVPNPTPAPDAETRFAEQLSQLEMMGFTNKTANIEELTRTGGNVEAAVDRLLQRPR